MKIMHMILSRGFSGSERTVAQMSGVQARDHEVTVILQRRHTSREGVSITQWLDPRIRVVEVGNWFLRRDIARAIERCQPDVIHAHLPHATELLAQIRPAAPTIVTLHLTANGPHVAAMDGVVCIASWQRRDIPQGYRGRVYRINPGYVRHSRPTPQQIEALRSELGVRPSEFLIGGVGRLTPTKGFDVLLEAFARTTLANAKLVIIGEGRDRRRLERARTARVSLPGFRTNVKDYYHAFDLFVCPSHAEALGFVLLEALDAGVPIIASDSHGPAEVLGKYPGSLFPVGDVAALANLLRHHHFARLPKRPQDLRPYCLETVAAQTESAYQELIELKRAASGGESCQSSKGWDP